KCRDAVELGQIAVGGDDFKVRAFPEFHRRAEIADDKCDGLAEVPVRRVPNQTGPGIGVGGDDHVNSAGGECPLRVSDAPTTDQYTGTGRGIRCGTAALGCVPPKAEGLSTVLRQSSSCRSDTAEGGCATMGPRLFLAQA